VTFKDPAKALDYAKGMISPQNTRMFIANTKWGFKVITAQHKASYRNRIMAVIGEQKTML